jgi:hypothetical protein
MTKKAYIIDADALIHAYRYDFPPEGNHDGFWDWLNDLASRFDLIIPESVREEIQNGNDGLNQLINSLDNLKFLPTSSSAIYLPTVLDAYGKLNEVDVEIIGGRADPYVIAHAIESNATIVTNEIREPGRSAPRNKKIPDICDGLKVNCIRYPHFLWEMRGY